MQACSPAPAAATPVPRVLTANALYPAIKDPKFAASGLDPGYLTTVPGTRAKLFYSEPDFDPVTQESPFYSPEARIHACIIPGSGHDLSLAVNHQLQIADAVAWSSSLVGQLRLAAMERVDENGIWLPWNSGLPWNCR